MIIIITIAIMIMIMMIIKKIPYSFHRDCQLFYFFDCFAVLEPVLNFVFYQQLCPPQLHIENNDKFEEEQMNTSVKRL